MNKLKTIGNWSLDKTRLSTLSILLLSILAGMYIGIAGLTSIMASYTITNINLSKIVFGFIFPLGLVLVTLAGSELFTGNNLMIVGVLNKQISIYQLCLNWIIVYIGNFIGSIIVTIIVLQSKLLSNQVLNTKIQTIYDSKLNYSFVQSVFLGIICNVLVCLAIWVSCDSQTKVDRIVSLFLPVMSFVIIGGEHSVANMFFLTIGSWSKGLGIINLNIFQNLIPVTIGNIIGGCFIGLVYYLINKFNTNII